jgi:hypothetical protein
VKALLNIRFSLNLPAPYIRLNLILTVGSAHTLVLNSYILEVAEFLKQASNIPA